MIYVIKTKKSKHFLEGHSMREAVYNFISYDCTTEDFSIFQKVKDLLTPKELCYLYNGLYKDTAEPITEVLEYVLNYIEKIKI